MMKSGKSDPLRALSDPLRMSMFELIKEGPKTAPELAEILDENRINLYHHLEVLEKVGLIQSAYKNSRAKVYTVEQSRPQITHQKQATTIRREKARSPTKSATSTLILSPPKDFDDYQKFKKLITQAAELVGIEVDETIEILQVHVNTEKSQIYQQKRNRATSIAKRKQK